MYTHVHNYALNALSYTVTLHMHTLTYSELGLTTYMYTYTPTRIGTPFSTEETAVVRSPHAFPGRPFFHHIGQDPCQHEAIGKTLYKKLTHSFQQRYRKHDMSAFNRKRTYVQSRLVYDAEPLKKSPLGIPKNGVVRFLGQVATQPAIHAMFRTQGGPQCGT